MFINDPCEVPEQPASQMRAEPGKARRWRSAGRDESNHLKSFRGQTCGNYRANMQILRLGIGGHLTRSPRLE